MENLKPDCGGEEGRIGYIHSIETFGTVDNGGIRFVIFMQGCIMRCKFCHNPDTWMMRGKPVTVDEMMKKIKGYKPFFELSGGGVTLSGGEPMLQYKFACSLFKECIAEGIHRAVDTSGYCRHGDFRSILELTDQVLFSVKVVNPEKHLRLTGVENETIIENLRIAADSHASVTIRYVLIPGINNSKDDWNDLIGLINSLGKRVDVDILPYHRMGRSKWRQLGLEYSLENVPTPTKEDLDKAKRILRESGIPLAHESGYPEMPDFPKGI